MLDTPDPITMDSRLDDIGVEPLNADLPMFVTESGMTTLVRLSQQ